MIAQFEVLLKNCFFLDLLRFSVKKNPKKGCTDGYWKRSRRRREEKGKEEKKVDVSHYHFFLSREA